MKSKTNIQKSPRTKPAKRKGSSAPCPGSPAPSVVALTKWMHEVTALLCFQPEVPLKHKEDLCAAMNEYDQVRRAEELTKQGNSKVSDGGGQ